MNRLTERRDNGVAVYKHPTPEPEGLEANRHAVLEKCCYYEDMEEQGKLLMIPCKPGDTVYAFRKGKIVEMIVTSVNVMEKSVLFLWKTKEEFALSPWLGGFTEKDIGVKVFLTWKEAKETLEGMKNEKS